MPSPTTDAHRTALANLATVVRRVLNVTVKVPAGELDRIDDCYVFTEHQYHMLDRAYAKAITVLSEPPHEQ